MFNIKEHGDADHRRILESIQEDRRYVHRSAGKVRFTTGHQECTKGIGETECGRLRSKREACNR